MIYQIALQVKNSFITLLLQTKKPAKTIKSLQAYMLSFQLYGIAN